MMSESNEKPDCRHGDLLWHYNIPSVPEVSINSDGGLTSADPEPPLVTLEDVLAWRPFLAALPFYDKSGALIDIHKWGKLFEDKSYRRIAKTKITSVPKPDRLFIVYTEWFGLDKDFYTTGQALIFETKVFAEDRFRSFLALSYCLYPTRPALSYCLYPTREEALAGHKAAVAHLVQCLGDKLGEEIVASDVP
ncbi:MAG: hypothetical protein ACREQ5_00630 [Candidatus Dormibacteria bacterium]